MRNEGADIESEDRDGVSAGYQADELVIRSSGMQFRPLDDVLPDRDPAIVSGTNRENGSEPSESCQSQFPLRQRR